MRFLLYYFLILLYIIIIYNILLLSNILLIIFIILGTSKRTSTFTVHQTIDINIDEVIDELATKQRKLVFLL